MCTSQIERKIETLVVPSDPFDRSRTFPSAGARTRSFSPGIFRSGSLKKRPTRRAIPRQADPSRANPKAHSKPEITRRGIRKAKASEAIFTVVTRVGRGLTGCARTLYIRCRQDTPTRQVPAALFGREHALREKFLRHCQPPGEKFGLTRISHRGAGHRLGKCLSLASCSAFWGSLQDTDCAGRARAWLRSNTRDDCCRRRNGTSKSSDVYRRPVESITVLFIIGLSKSRDGWTCHEHPLQSTAIPHIMGGWIL